MANIVLSYVLTTRNKLPYLKEVLPAIIASKKEDEEIIIADGASTDGTSAYLQELLAQKKIDYFVSEPDFGEAHGFNKLIARADGELIKLVTDDDALYYPAIAECKKFMLEHPEIDFLSTDGVKRRNNKTYPFSPMNSQPQFDLWRRRHVPFAFCGLGIMIRKSSLPLLGYLHTGFVRVDAEYALRVTASRAKIAWYTGEAFVHILNSDSNSITRIRQITEEMDRLEAVYLGKPLQSVFEKNLKNIVRPIRNWLKNKRTVVQPPLNAEVAFTQWQDMYKTSVQYLAENAQENGATFLY